MTLSTVKPADILILSNGPGEITTWVRPIVKSLREQLGDTRSKIRISIILSPCPHSTGQEAQIALSYPEVDRVQSSEHFLAFLIWGKTKDNWDWREKGVVLFLGGDQFFTLVIGKRLKYATVIYAEWDARWYRFVDRFGAMNDSIVNKVPPKYHDKFTTVGDLIAEVSKTPPLRMRFKNKVEETGSQLTPTIGLLPGSKAAKLAQGVPLCLAIATIIAQKRPEIKFIIPVAPTLDLATLAKYADPNKNPVLNLVNGIPAELIYLEEKAYLKTLEGLKIELITHFPAYDRLSQCTLCLTTVGANTAELGSLAIPSIVLIPTQQLDAMRSWDGLPGILANLPLIGSIFAKIINLLVLRKKRLFAWPNIWANAEIMPELIGNLQAKDVANLVLDYLENPEKLERMRDRLREIRGRSGAANKITKIIEEELEKIL
ncbi:MAG: lipid-A-disaccharide synthase [Prochloraceae cyanobacterium]|nr:lipid-A-disaccharide synthase [Prochloraceae cyanobacterium]